jgi:H+/Cl- antiporter ClcA
MQQLGKWVIVLGIILVIAGALLYLLDGKLNWLGRLPGDIRVERENFRFYFPITTMILVSIILSAIIWLIQRFFK